jgi:hypothetical protein
MECRVRQPGGLSPKWTDPYSWWHTPMVEW